METRLRSREDAEAAMVELGHQPTVWEPGGIAGYPRNTCGACYHAVVVGPTHVYGTALSEPCRSATEEGQS